MSLTSDARTVFCFRITGLEVWERRVRKSKIFKLEKRLLGDKQSGLMKLPRAELASRYRGTVGGHDAPRRGMSGVEETVNVNETDDDDG